MTRDVIFLDEASSQLTRLGTNIAGQSSEAAANRYLDRLQAACLALGHFPERGTKRDEILKGLRTIGFERRVTIAFRVLETHVEIVTIAYGGRDFEADLQKDK